MRAQVVVLQGARVLLCRHRAADREYWVLPGGALEPGETADEAAVREVREETGLEVRITGLLFVEEPGLSGNVVIRHPRYTFEGRIVSGCLTQVSEPGRARGNKGYLAGAAWMPFTSPVYDAATLRTLTLVRESLRSETGADVDALSVAENPTVPSGAGE